jgi:hypothetical protein
VTRALAMLVRYEKMVTFDQIWRERGRERERAPGGSPGLTAPHHEADGDRDAIV